MMFVDHHGAIRPDDPFTLDAVRGQVVAYERIRPTTPCLEVV